MNHRCQMIKPQSTRVANHDRKSSRFKKTNSHHDREENLQAQQGTDSEVTLTHDKSFLSSKSSRIYDQSEYKSSSKINNLIKQQKLNSRLFSALIFGLSLAFNFLFSGAAAHGSRKFLSGFLIAMLLSMQRQNHQYGGGYQPAYQPASYSPPPPPAYPPYPSYPAPSYSSGGPNVIVIPVNGAGVGDSYVSEGY